MMDVKPTRMELLNLKRKLVLAKNGYKLLKKKRDGLIMELRSMLKDVKDIKKDMITKLREGNRLIFQVEMKESSEEIDLVSEIMMRSANVDVLVRNVMGVPLPKISIELKGKTANESKYALMFFSYEIMKAVRVYEDLFVQILKVAEIEMSIRNLLEEIEKTKRRVNALENKVIPEIEESIAWIKMVLDEMERENVMRLKRIKDKSSG